MRQRTSRVEHENRPARLALPRRDCGISFYRLQQSANSHSGSAVMHEYAGQARSTKWARDLLIVAIGSATPF